MTLFDTIDYFLQQTAGDMESLSLEIREETNYEDNGNAEYLCEEYDFNKELHDNLLIIKSELARLQRYDEELTKVMYPDFKDWHQGSKEEYPELAAWVITNLREQLNWANETIDRLTEQLEKK